MNIDCDLYSSTKTIFDLLGHRIIPGTVIVFDEYIGYKSWKNDEFKAFQEAIAQYQWKYQVLTFSFASKQVAVKII
jgi:predicted negative regulator of RcsB-dependent stress response